MGQTAVLRRGGRVAAGGVLIALLSVFGAALPAQAVSPTVPFADANLKACVLETLSLPGSEVTVADLESLTQLECEGRSISDIAPLSKAKELTILRLGRNDLTTVPSLAALTSLSVLELSDNDLTDIGGLAGATALERVDVSYNRLQSVAVLRGLPVLDRVVAKYNSIGSIGDFSGLDHLEYLDLSHNSLADASAFAGGLVLHDVNLSFNLLTDVQFASRLGQVTTLNLAYNRITSVVPLGRLGAAIDVRNQSLQLPPIAVDMAEALPVVRSADLAAIALQVAADSQAYGALGTGGFTWRSNGLGQLLWSDSSAGPAGHVIAFDGRILQTVTRGTLIAPTPTITGAAVRGGALKAVTGEWGPAPVALNLQWRRNGVDIGGATGEKYVLLVSDVGKQISVAVTGSKTSFTTVTTVSASTAPVVAKSLTATPVPTVSGTAKVGSTLAASAGDWQPEPVTLTYQWMRGASPIAGATSPTYTLSNDDANSTITVTVTGAKTGYVTASKTSAPTVKVTGGAIVAVTPTITGTAAVGKTLTAVTGTWSPSTVTFAYQWKRAGAPIVGATGATYLTVAEDLGKQITVTVTGSAPGFTSVAKTSAPLTIKVPK